MTKTISSKVLAITLAMLVALTFMPANANAAAVKRPAKVKFAKCSVTASSVTLKWKKAKSAKKYEVYQLKAKKYKKIKTVKKAKLTVKKLKANTKYSFKVRAINGKKKGKFSAVKRLRTKKAANTTKKTIPKTTPGTNVDTKNPDKAELSDVGFEWNLILVEAGKTENARVYYNVLNGHNPSASAFTVTSSDNKVATASVAKGGSNYVVVKVKGVKAGKATITLKGYNHTDKLVVKVEAKATSASGGTTTTGGNTTGNTESNNSGSTEANQGGNTSSTTVPGPAASGNTGTGNSNSSSAAGGSGNNDSGNADYVSLQSMSFSKSSLEIDKGTSTTLTLSYSPQNASVLTEKPSFSTYNIHSYGSRDSISIVSESTNSVTIKANELGETELTAGYYDRKQEKYVSAKCKITVKYSDADIAKFSKSIKLVNRLPLYDGGMPDFDNILPEYIKETKNLADRYSNNVMFLHINENDVPLKDLVFFNKTTNRELGKVSWSRQSDCEGFSYYSLADVDYVKPYDFQGELKRGGYLIPFILDDSNVAPGENTIQLLVSDNGTDIAGVYAEVKVNANSRAKAYADFADKIIKESKNYVAKDNAFYVKEASSITKNEDLFYELYCAQTYISHITEYGPTDTLGAPIYRLSKVGSVIDSREGGCEHGAIMMCLVAQRLGINAKPLYTSSLSGGVHCICEIADSESLFGNDEVTFDATPHATAYSRASLEKCLEYVNSITKIF